MSAISDAVKAAQVTQAQPADNVDKTKKKTAVSGKTIGNPQLSEKAAKYYEELKRKYSGMEFILVSEDQKAAAQMQAGKYANASKMVVLIDEEKIEKMAEDESYRKKYEGIIANASGGLSKMAQSLSRTNANIKGFGMQVKDNGMASFFAVLDKSSAAQRERIEKKAAQKKADKKAAAKKAEKKEREERLEKSREESRAERERATEPEEDTVTITANSIEELMRKINDFMFMGRSDLVQTEEEKQVGQSFDFSI